MPTFGGGDLLGAKVYRIIVGFRRYRANLYNLLTPYFTVLLLPITPRLRYKLLLIYY